MPIKGSLFHINSNFGSTVGDTLVFVYSRCWKTCLTFLNEHVLSLMEDIDIKQIESFFEDFLKYPEYTSSHSYMKDYHIQDLRVPKNVPNKNVIILLIMLDQLRIAC